MGNAPKKFITTQEAADLLGGLRRNTLEGWRLQGIGPKYYKFGRLVRYSIDDLNAYIEAQSRTSTSKTD